MDYLSLPSTSWMYSGWSRLRPLNLWDLMIVIGEATRQELDGDLQELLGLLPCPCSGHGTGVSTPLVWHEDDPDDTEDEAEQSRSWARQCRQAFAEAARGLGLAEPATLGDLAAVLAGLGVLCRSTDDGVVRWRLPARPPAPTEVLPFADEVRQREEKVRQDMQVDLHAGAIVPRLEHHDPQRAITITDLARSCEMDPQWVRQALMKMVDSAEVVIERPEGVCGRQEVAELPEHARFLLTPHWARIDERYSAVEAGCPRDEKQPASDWDLASAAAPGARFATPEQYRTAKQPLVSEGLVEWVLTDALAEAADQDGVIADFDLRDFYTTHVRNVLRSEDDADDFALTYDRFTAMALADSLNGLLLRGLLAHRGKGDSYDYRLALPTN